MGGSRMCADLLTTSAHGRYGTTSCPTRASILPSPDYESVAKRDLSTSRETLLLQDGLALEALDAVARAAPNPAKQLLDAAWDAFLGRWLTRALGTSSSVVAGLGSSPGVVPRQCGRGPAVSARLDAVLGHPLALVGAAAAV